MSGSMPVSPPLVSTWQLDAKVQRDADQCLREGRSYQFDSTDPTRTYGTCMDPTESVVYVPEEDLY